MVQLRAFGLLTVEALRDAVRRRLVIVLVLMTALLLYWVGRCAGAMDVGFNDMSIDPDAVSLAVGTALFAWLSLGVLNLAGLLATNSLAEPVSDRSVVLWLSRPIARSTYAAARLAGVLTLVVACALVLLGGVALLMGLDPRPAALGTVMCVIGCIPVASFAMGIALWVPRIVSALVTLVAVQIIAFVNVAFLMGLETEGWPLWVETVAPPLGHGLAQAVLLNNPDWGHLADPVGVGGRLVLWAAVSAALLLVAFRRLELPKT